MRAVLVTVLILGAVPFIFGRPWLGVLLWVLVGILNPHRLTWGFSYAFPFAAIIAAVTILSGMLSGERRRIPITAATAALAAYVLYMNVTTLVALDPGDELWLRWSGVMKMFLMVFVSMWLLTTRRHVHLLIWVIVVSVGYYGVKGGVWTILNGGENRVWGPPASFIEDNNALALALIIAIPLMQYLKTTTVRPWVRRGLTAAMLLCGAAALGSYSRGALLAIAAMAAAMWLKSSRKSALGIVFALLIPVAIALMPGKWEDRMSTISSYQADSSASSRLYAWETMLNIALDRPLVGAGFVADTKEIFERYAPDPTGGVFVAHSIYFQALGEHGFVGLLLYLLVLFTAWRTASWIVRHARGAEQRWAKHLASAIQISMIGFMTGGAFLNLAYFDMPYYLIAALVLTRVLVEKELGLPQRSTAQAPAPAQSDTGGAPYALGSAKPTGRL